MTTDVLETHLVAYLSLREKDPSLFPDRAHFIAYASRVMRGLVIDFARNRRTLKRGGEFHITALPINVPGQEVDCAELERLTVASAEPLRARWQALARLA